jgi:hypothetical protein
MRSAIPLVLLLCACATAQPAAVWLKPGEPVAEAEATLARCTAEARAAFPPRPGFDTLRQVTVGVGVGNGGLHPGLGGAFGVTRVDRNEDAREAALGACMARNGYALTMVPGCRGTAAPLVSQPFDLRGVCVTRDDALAAP